MSAAYLRPMSGDMQEAVGAIEAQRLIERVGAGEVTHQHGWLRYSELASAHGHKSAACRAYVIELLKRSAAISAVA